MRLIGSDEKKFSPNTDGQIVKIYDLNNLLDEDWGVRVNLINNLAPNYRVVPRTKISVDTKQGIAIYSQQRVVNVSQNSFNIKYLYDFAEGLDNLASGSFIHGDINYKNILFNGAKYYLIDLEPSLIQRKNGKDSLMYTAPYISVDDFTLKSLSTLTDKIGFLWFCERLISKKRVFDHKLRMNYIQKGISPVEIKWGLTETELDKLSFGALIDIVPISRNK